MVFGSTISTSSWEAFRRAIEAMSEVFSNRPDLVIKHRRYLDMIWWTEIYLTVEITPAIACTMLRGFPAKLKSEIRQKARIFVDDELTYACALSGTYGTGASRAH